MLTLMAVCGFTLLFLGVPFVITLIFTSLLSIAFFLPEINLTIVVQQILLGIRPVVLVCIPMFILAAGIIVEGESGGRLANLVRAYIGHIPGGLPIATNVSCTFFGAVSGSTQATVAAIGRTFRPLLLKAGYSSSFSLGLVINSAEVALLIPPSIGFIVYGVVTKTSIGQLFLAGVGPGFLICLLFSIFCFFYSKVKNIGLYPKASC